MEKKLIKFVAKAFFPTRYGEFELYAFLEKNAKEHLALVKGNAKDLEGCYVRIHSECKTGDVFGSLKCDCEKQLEKSLKFLAKQKKGILFYLDHEGRGIGLVNKVRAYHLQDNGLDTYEANVKLGFRPDERNYTCVVEMLKFFKVKKIRLLTDNPEKTRQLEQGGIEIMERKTLAPGAATKFNKKYLEAKKERFKRLMEKRA